jgi:hypothetical protein
MPAMADTAPYDSSRRVRAMSETSTSGHLSDVPSARAGAPPDRALSMNEENHVCHR